MTFNFRRKYGRFGSIRSNFSRFENDKVVNVSAGSKNINRVWSKYQKAIFEDIAFGEGHTVVDAAPGSGKTTTIIEGLNYIPERFRNKDSTLFTSFNKAIANDISSRISVDVDVRTIHYLGLKLVRENWGLRYKLSGKYYIDNKNLIAQDMVSNIVGSEPEKYFTRMALMRGLSLAKTTLSNSPEAISKMIDEYDLDIQKFSKEEFVDHVWGMMCKTREEPLHIPGCPNRAISFDDMIWLPYVHGWKPTHLYERIFIDEAQDLSKARTEIILSYLAPDGKILAVGDEYQAIYGFAGARENALTELCTRLNAKRLPLSVSYRCPKKVVALAKEINKSIEHHESAKDGYIESINIKDILEYAKAGHAILSRTNAPLVRLCLQMASKQIRANIQGRDIGDRLAWRIKCMNPSSVQDLYKKSFLWMEGEKSRLKEKNRDISLLLDEYECIIALCDNASSLNEIIDLIDILFDDRDDKTIIRLSSTHKFKGLERDVVFVLKDTYNPGVTTEESNLWYVAITRAKSHLYIVNGKMKRKK